MGADSAVTLLPERLRLTLTAIKFSHSIFALPFALLSAFFAANGVPPARTLTWIVVAAIGARTAAMGFNRIADRSIDAANPRTANRELPAGRLSVFYMSVLVLAGAALLLLAAAELNRLCLMLSGPTLAVLFGYSLTKRFTSASHLVLGFALGLAPVGAWVAVRGTIAAIPLVFCAAVTFWTAGFDVLYSLQDLDFDRRAGLFSIPARIGAARAILVSRLFHLATFVLLVLAAILSGRGWIFFTGVLAAGALLVWEQSLVDARDLSRLDAAFFTANGLVSVVLFFAGALDLAVLGPAPSRLLG